MKLKGCFWTALVLVFIGPKSFATGSADTAWNLAVLDHLIASASPGQGTVLVGDMNLPTGYLQGWRNRLAGGPQPNLAFEGNLTAWPGGNVYYTFSNNIPAVKQQAMLDGMGEWATFANLHFIPWTNEANYVTIFEAPGLEGGQSMVGMVGGQQFLQIGPTAWNRPTICHELGHTLGLVHEHQRSDRDSYVTILTNNIEPGAEGNFVLLPDSLNETPYDFLSIMHYSRNGLSVNSQDTIEPLAPYGAFINVMGQQFDPVLSRADRAGMAAIYGPGPTVTNIVTNTQDSGPGSLRAALYFAFDHPGTTITFDIPMSDPGYSNSVFNILPSGVLPGLWGNTTIDGSTETNVNPNGPSILLNGVLNWPLDDFPNGLRFRGTNSTIRGLVINNFPSDGILIEGTNTVGNVVSGCYLGIDPTGTLAVTNGYVPVEITGGAVSNIIGGTSVAARNVISGSGYQGISMHGPGTCFNVIEGNYIGLAPTGAAALSNTWEGIQIWDGAQSNLVGGYSASAGNVISGNGLQGVLISDLGTGGNIVAGNYIGIDPTGSAAISNGWSGVEIDQSHGNVVGPGNVLSGNGNYGVIISWPGATGNLVMGNFIGLNANGTAAAPNNYGGVGIFSGAQSNIVGGITLAARNVISGNTGQGVVINNSGANNNWIVGNYIGVNPAGAAAIGNGGAGVGIYSGAQSNIVGGMTAAARNVVSGNANQGVAIGYVGASGNEVVGNYIGVNATGTAALGNAWAGADCFGGASGNQIGGDIPGAGNVISGNQIQGVLLQDPGTSGNSVQGNLIGLNAAGNSALSNAWTGVEIYNEASANLIGGYGGARNFISGNGAYGLAIDYGAGTNVVQGNTIGLDEANDEIVTNSFAAVAIYTGANGNLIGGVSPGAANLIAGSTADGVEVFDDSAYNTIRGNSIFGSAFNAIGLYNDANQGLPAPLLAAAVVTTNTVITGSYTGASGATYLIDFYSDAPPAGSAQCRTYLGSLPVIGNGATSGFTASLGAHLPAGRAVTATATDALGNTSPASAGIAVSLVSTPGDGIPDAWRAEYFGGSGATTNSESAAWADPDHDGLSNYQEFLAGTNPTNAASVVKLTAFRPAGATDVISLNSADGIVYRILSSDELADGNWSILADQVMGTGTNMSFNDPAAPFLPMRFYRAEVLW